MNVPILTIGIPTYNRPEYITTLVRRLLPQLNEKVLLVVRDNCSEIPISSLFTDEEKQHFVIHRNKVNIGGDANIASVIYDAETPWVWALGDDDLPLPNAVETILGYIDNYPCEAYIGFHSYIAKETDGFSSLTEVMKYRYMYSNFLFMSSGIYNRKLMANEIFYYYENLSSMCGQVIYVLKHVERYEDKCLFVHDEILDKHGNANAWTAERQWKRSSVIFDLFEDKRKQLDSTLFKGIAFEWIRGCFVVEGWNFWKRFKMMRFVFRTVGTINVFKYNWYVIIQYVFKSMVPNSLYLKLKERTKVKYMRTKSMEAGKIGQKKRF